jgi:hypothetical protein
MTNTNTSDVINPSIVAVDANHTSLKAAISTLDFEGKKRFNDAYHKISSAIGLNKDEGLLALSYISSEIMVSMMTEDSTAEQATPRPTEIVGTAA